MGSASGRHHVGDLCSLSYHEGLKQLIDVPMSWALIIGLAAGIGSWIAMIPVIRRQSRGLENRNKSLKVLFGIPLVVSAALLSFAHGANDVANAVVRCGHRSDLTDWIFKRRCRHSVLGDVDRGGRHFLRPVSVLVPN